MGILSDLYDHTRLCNKNDHKEAGDNTPDKSVEETTEKEEKENKKA